MMDFINLNYPRIVSFLILFWLFSLLLISIPSPFSIVSVLISSPFLTIYFNFDLFDFLHSTKVYFSDVNIPWIV